MVISDQNRPLNTEQIVVRMSRQEDETILDAIVRALAIAKNVPVSELDPLYEQVDSEALVSLLEAHRRRDSTVGIEFAVDEYRVLVSDGGSVCVHTGGSVMQYMME